MSVNGSKLGLTLEQVRKLIEEEIARLQRKLSVLSEDEGAVKTKRAYNKRTAPKKRIISAKGRKAISKAMKARWAAKKSKTS